MKRCTCGCDEFTAKYTETNLGRWFDDGQGDPELSADECLIDSSGPVGPFACRSVVFPKEGGTGKSTGCEREYATWEDIPDHEPAGNLIDPGDCSHPADRQHYCGPQQGADGTILFYWFTCLTCGGSFAREENDRADLDK